MRAKHLLWTLLVSLALLGAGCVNNEVEDDEPAESTEGTDVILDDEGGDATLECTGQTTGHGDDTTTGSGQCELEQ